MNSYLITGGAGYIGSHLAEKLIKLKKKVIIYDNLSTGSKRLVDKNAVFINGDINNLIKVSKIIKKYNVKTVFHFAASINVSEAERNKKKYFKNNILGTKNLLKGIEKSNNKVNKFIFASSCTVYGSIKKSITEKTKIRPSGYYGYTKSISEKEIKKFSKKNKCNYAILRYFNVAGASGSGKVGEVNKNNGHLFKNLALLTQKKKKIFYIYGNDFNTKDGTCIRDYIHITDLINIHLKVCDFLKNNNKSIVLNCGYGKGYSVLEIVNKSKKFIKGLTLKFKNRRIGDVSSAYCSNYKLKKMLRWKPKYAGIKCMIKSAINWEKNLEKKIISN
tara:strand:+ start:2370 stop:3365 length:996 start_codon:yes stop_codon:yes gene_type:complete